MGYLLIENRVQQIPSIEALRMLGVSFSRGDEGSIGQFGSGFPASLALLARFGLLESSKLCLGKDVYTFTTVDHVMKNSRGEREYKSEIRMKKQNGGSWDLNVSTEFGALDWTDETMAIREFVSNALDGANQFDGSYGSFKIEDIGDDPKHCRAKDGFIRVYIKTNDRIDHYLKDIHKYFLCISPEYDPSKSVFVNETGGPARVYRKGVLVGEFGESSIFHYNIKNIDLKESRIVDSYEAKWKCARAISTASTDVIAKFLESVNMAKENGNWENSFAIDYVDPTTNYGLGDKQKLIAKSRWKDAIDAIMPDAIICNSEHDYKMVAAKGLNAITPISGAMGDLLKAMGATTSDKVLNKNEIEGKILIEASENVIDCLDWVWSAFDAIGVTAGKEKPNVECFRQNTVVPGAMDGYYRPGGNTVFINADHAEDRGSYLAEVMIEEVAHYITGAMDCTREFQSFAFKALAKSLRK